MILPNHDQFPLGSPLPTALRAAPAPSKSSAPSAIVLAERAELTALVIRAQSGDMAAQNDLVRRYQRRIFGHVSAIIRQPDATDDVTQTVFIKMVRRLTRLRDPALFECWLFTLSRNSALDFIRHRRRRPVTVAVDEELFELPDTTTTQANEILDELDLALAQLKPVDRSLITLYVQGHSYRVLADREGLTAGAVKARLHRIRPFLRKCLGGSRHAPAPVANRIAA